jgi:hypothetical protein
VITGAEAVVDGAVPVHEENGEGEVVVEGVDPQVDAGNVEDARADVALRRLEELFGGTSNLLVEGLAVPSGLSAEDDQEGLARGEGVPPGRLEIEPPGELRVTDVGGGLRPARSEEEGQDPGRSGTRHGSFSYHALPAHHPE